MDEFTATTDSVESKLVTGGTIDSPSDCFYKTTRIDLPVPENLKIKDNVYASETTQPVFFNDSVMVGYTQYYETDSDVEAIQAYVTYDLSGKMLGTITLPFDCFMMVQCLLDIDEDGNVVFFTQEYDNEIGMPGDIYITKYTMTGEQVTDTQLLLENDGEMLSGAIVTEEGQYVIALTNSIYCIVDDDQGGYSVNVMEMVTDSAITCRSMFESNDNIYLEILDLSANEKTLLYKLHIDVASTTVDLEDGRYSDNLMGMNVFQTNRGLYASTKNAFGKVDLQTGEFKQLLDWNQVDADRATLVWSNVHVVSEGAYTQTVSLLSSANVTPIPQPVVDVPVVESQNVSNSQYEQYIATSESAVTDDTNDTDDESSGVTELYISGLENLEQPFIVHIEPADSNPHDGQPVIWVGGIDLADGYISKLIHEYNQDPASNAWVKIYDYSDFGSYIWDSNYREEQIETIRAQLRSGTGPDLIYGVEEFSFFDTDGSMLTDLYPYMNSMNGINMDEYFTNLFEAYEMDGKLYQVPLAVHLRGVLVNEELTNGPLEDVSYLTLRALAEEDSSLHLFAGDDAFTLTDWAYNYIVSSGIDYTNNTLVYDDDALASSLQILKECYTRNKSAQKYSARWWYFNEYYGVVMPSEVLSDNVVAMWNQGVDTIVEFSEQNSEKGSYRWYGYPSEEGESPLIYDATTMGITNYSTHKEQAWELIRYLLSETAQSSLVEYYIASMNYEQPCIPVNVMSFYTYCERCKYRYENDPDTIYMNFTSGEFIDDTMQLCSVGEYEEYVRSATVHADMNIELRGIIEKNLDEYIKNTATLDVAVKQIRTDLEDYLAKNS